MITLLGISMVLFFILFCYFLLRKWQVDSFRRFLRKGDICTFFIGETRWIGVVSEFLEGIVTIRYFIGNDEKTASMHISEIYP